jgi:hypothetical protein
MPLIKEYSYTLAAPDADGIAVAQQLVGAGDLALAGALTSGGTYTTSDKCAKQIAIESAGNLSGITFTVYGKLVENGEVESEAVTGPNNGIVETTGYFYTVTRVAAGAAVGSDVTVGTSDEVATPFKFTDLIDALASITVSGTINVDVQVTAANVYKLAREGSYSETTAAWADSATTTMSAALANHSSGTAYGRITGPIGAIRVVSNSYSAGATIKLRLVPQRDYVA